MSGILKIKDGQGVSLAFDIPDLLAFVGEEGEQWAWRLFPTGEATDIIGEKLPFGELTVWEFGCQAGDSEEGIPLSWEQRHGFASAVQQTIWGTYIACYDANAFLRLKSLYLDEHAYIDRAGAEYYRQVAAAFQAVDSSFWLVYAHDDVLLHRLTHGFRDVETLRTW